MATTVVQQPQQQPTTAPAGTKGPQSPAAPNDQAAAAAKTERRRRSALAVPPSWQAALSTLLPADPGVPLGSPPVADVRRAAFRLEIRDVHGYDEALAYLTDAEANDAYLAAIRDQHKNAADAKSDKGTFQALRNAVAALATGGDLATGSLAILGVLATASEDAKTYLQGDDAASAAPITRPLRAYIDDPKHFGDPNDPGTKAQKSALESLVTAIHHPHSAAAGTPPPITPAPLTAPQTLAFKAMITEIQTKYPLVEAAKIDPKAAIKPNDLAALLAKINAAEGPVREHVYAWRDEKTGKGVLQLFGSHLSPSQVEEVNATLDPVERLYKDCGDIRNGRSPTKQPGSEYQVVHDFLAVHLGDEATRKRVRDHAPLMQQYVQWWPDGQRKILLRMIVTGREQPDAVDRVHDAAEAGDSAAAVTAIYELGKSPQLQDLRKDLIFVHRLQDRCGKRIAWNGIAVSAYELFLQMCGVDPNNTHEAGSLDKQTEVDPNNAKPAPLTPEERGALDAELYTPAVGPIVDQLNSWWTRDSKVMEALRAFQQRCAKKANQDLLRRANEAPGPELSKRIQAAGCDVRLKLQRGLDADNLAEAERILAFVVDQATVGVVGGQGTLATDNRPQSGQGKVPLEQALRETTLGEGGPVLTQVIHDAAHALADEFGRWFGARAGHIRTIWQDYHNKVSDAVCAELREKTGMPRVWPIELLANAFVQVGGGTLQSKLQSELGNDPVITDMGMKPGDVDARRTLAEQKVVQDNHDESKNTAQLATAQAQVQQAAQLDQFKAPAKELFDGLAALTRDTADAQLTLIGGKLAADLKLGPVQAAPKNVTAGPVAAPLAEHDVSARPGGPAHPDQPTPTDFVSYYRHDFGIDPRRHAVEVAKALASKERTAEAVGKLLGVDDPSLFAPPKAPTDQLAITPDNITLVGPDFTIEEAQKRAHKMWDLLHDNGQVQLIRQQCDGRTAEEQRLIHIAFRQLSGGIELAFYIQQHLSQGQAEAAAAGSGDPSSMPLSVGGGGTGDADKRGVRVIGDAGETAMLLEVSQKGRVSLEKRIAGSVAANNMNDVYAAIESASPDERRAILANDALMNQLRKFGDDSYEWNRIYKGLSGESDMFDRLESRAHGSHGFLGAFEGTDEKGMSTDIQAYAKQRAKAIRAEVTKNLCGDATPTPAQKKTIDEAVAKQLSAEFQSIAENPSIRAIIHDELSGVELAQREGLLMNAGEDSKVASSLTEGDWTENEEKILDDIKHMSPAERKRCRNNPEYLNQLHKAIQSQATWRDAMIALDSDVDGTKEGDEEDDFAKLERASRSERQDTTELMFEQDEVIQALSRLSPEQYARLQADPRLQAQILTSLEGHPDKLAMARQMMAFNSADAGKATGLTIGDAPDPAKNVFTRKQVERLAFMKFGAENRIRAGSSRSWAMLVQAAEAIYNMKLQPSAGEEEEAAGGEGPKNEGGEPDAASAASAPVGPGEKPGAKTGPSPQTTAAAPTLADAGAVRDPKAGEAAIEERLRHEILTDTQGIFVTATIDFGDQKGANASHERTSITPQQQQDIITKAILHEKDPSDNLLMASTGWLGDDEERIKETIKKASDDQLITEWVTVLHKTPNGSDSLGDKYQAWKTARDATGTDTTPPQGDPKGPQPKRNPKVGSAEWKARTAFKCHVIDTSEVFEELLLKYTGGLFADDAKMKKGEDRVRDNSEWLEWRTIVRERIPNLDKTKIATAIHANNDAEAMEVINDPTLRNALNSLAFDEERYAVDRGENSNYNMDRVTAGGQGLALDNAMGDYRREVLTSVVSKGPDAGNDYGTITGDESARIGEAKARFNQSDSEFREAKAAVANIAATLVALVITAVVTILTAGTATGPVAVILLGAATAAASSAGTQLTKEAIQGTDFDLGKEGLQSIARDTVMGAVTAGATFYAGKMAGSLWNTTSAAQQAAMVGNLAKTGGFLREMGKSATEMAMMTGMEGMFESGMAAFDPALWLDGWHEGWRRGSAAARERAQEVPGEMIKAALLAAFSTTVMAGGNKVLGRGGEEAAEGELRHQALGNRMTLAERTAMVTKNMGHGSVDGLITGVGELLFDERTFRGEDLKPIEIVGTLSKNVIDMMNMSATNVHMSDAAGVTRMRKGGRELALHGSELSPQEQTMYAELVTKGSDGTIITIAEFKKLRAEALAREAPAPAAATTTGPTSEPKVTTVDPVTSKATPTEISKITGDEVAKLGELTPTEKSKLEDMLRAHGTEHGREMFEAWRAKQPAATVSTAPDPIAVADAAFARGDLAAAHDALAKLDPEARGKVEQTLLTKYGTTLGAKEAPGPIGAEAGDTQHRVAGNGPHVTERVKTAMDAMSVDARAKLETTISRAQNDGQRVLMERAVAAGHGPEEVHALFLAMHGMGEGEVMNEFSGVGLVQFYQASCVPTSYQIALAEVDPVYALKLRNNPEMVLGQQRDALAATGGARHERADVRKGQDVPSAMQDHLDDPRARKALDNPDNYGPGTSGGIEATKMADQALHKQLEATTGVKYDVITNDSLQYETPGQGEFGHHAVPHAQIVAALDAGLPVLIGMMGHANVIVGHTVGSDGKPMYMLSDPMSGKTSKLPADLLDIVMVQSLTIPRVAATEPRAAIESTVAKATEGKPTPTETKTGGTQTGGGDPIKQLTPEELQALLRRQSGDELKEKALRPDISGPLATEEGKKIGESLPPAPEGQYRTIDGSLGSTQNVSLSAEARQYLADRAAKRAELSSGEPRKVVVDGGGPTGALTALQAFNLGHDVTIVEQRENATLPILWSNRPGNMDVLQLIDPVLAARVKAASGDIHFYEHVDQAGKRDTATPDASRTANGERATGDPRAIAGETSSWQSQNKTEVNLMWARLEELAAAEATQAKAEGREPRLKLLRGFEVKSLPQGEGDKRGIVVQKVEQRLQKMGADGRPERADGKPVPNQPYTAGDPVPQGYAVVRGTDGKDISLGTPDDIFVAEGSGSKTRDLAGSKSVDVGPSAQYIAGYFEGAPLKSSADAEGNRQQGGSRSIVDTARDGSALHAVAGTGSHLDGTWALPEIDPTLDLKDPKSIEKYFGKPMTPKEATLTYYKQQVAKVLEVSPEAIPDTGFVFGPAAFTIQSHVSTPVANDAQNVHLIGDSRGNSHFLASLGKVTGTGTHQMAIRQYFDALAWGLDPEIATAILERRLDAGTRVWLKSGLPSFTDRAAPTTGGAADGASVMSAGADALATKPGDKSGEKGGDKSGDKGPATPPAETIVKAVAGPSGSVVPEAGPITADHFPQAQLVVKKDGPQSDPNGYRTFLADSANQAMADLGNNMPMSEVMARIEARRYERAQLDAARAKAALPSNLDAATRVTEEAKIDANVEKMRTPIKPGDPNYDPFGQLSNLDDGPGKRTRAEIGGVMNDRFAGVDGDTVVNKVTVDIDGKSTVLDGNTLHREDSATAIDDKKGNKYGYDPAKDTGKLVVSQTADPANQQIFRDAGMKKLDGMSTVHDFADAAYLLFMGPVVNRGSDSNVRTLLTAAYTKKFGKPAPLPQDIDIQAYARDQEGFKTWLVAQLQSDSKNGGSSADEKKKVR